jgi:hypothetical protein
VKDTPTADRSFRSIENKKESRVETTSQHA